MKWYYWLILIIILVLVVWGGYKLYASTSKTTAGTGASVSVAGNTLQTGITKRGY